MPGTRDIADCIEGGDLFVPVIGDEESMLKRKNRMAKEVLEGFLSHYGHREEVKAYHVPGRLEFTGGKHTDYVGLPVPNFAVDRGFFVLASPADTPRIRMAESGMNYPTISFAMEHLKGDVQALAVPCEIDGRGDDQWRNYPITVLQRMYRDFNDRYPLGGVDIAFGSDLPPASGMSSSSALMIMTFVACAGATGLLESKFFGEAMRGKEDRNSLENMALYLACCENGSRFENAHTGITLEGKSGVGTFGGSQDHVAILNGRKGCLSTNDFCPIQHLEEVCWPQGLGVAVCYAQPASKTAEAKQGFNALRTRGDLVSEALSEWLGCPGEYELIGDLLRDHPGIDFKDAMEFLHSNEKFTENRLAERWEMAYVQSQIHLPEIVRYLRRERFIELGSLTSREHAMSCINLGNISPLVDEVQKCALASRAYGASGFGGGFGGSLFALVERERMDQFLEEWKFKAEPKIQQWQNDNPDFEYETAFFAVRPAAGTRELCVEETGLIPAS